MDRILRLALFLVLLTPAAAWAQPWAGIVDPQRAADWSLAGVRGGIPSGSWTRCTTGSGTVVLPPGTSAAAINAAIASCNANHYVELGSGTFNLSASILIGRNDVALRGQGAAGTRLVFSSPGSVTGCGWFVHGAITICPGSVNIGAGGGPALDNTATWTAGYAKGTTIVTVSTGANLVARSGTTPGTTLFLDQINDTSDGFPAAGDVYICDNQSNGCSWEGNNSGGNGTSRLDRSLAELHEVVSCSPACGTAASTQVTIDPPIHAPVFRATQSPAAYWGNDGSHVKRSGVEDLTVDYTATGGFMEGFYAVNVSNVWSRGVAYIYNGSSTNFINHHYLLHAFRVTTRDGYTYGPIDNANPNTNYAYTVLTGGSNLHENNIHHHYLTGPADSDSNSGSVTAYNYSNGGHYTSDFQPHGSGDVFNLWEGNNVGIFWSDNIHGTHHFNTLFRNHFDHIAHNGGSVAENGGILLHSHNRFFNLIGNVIGNGSITTYTNDRVGNPPVPAYMVGFQGVSSQPGNPPNDTHVLRTLMRWGNWDSVTSTDDLGANSVPPGNDRTGVRFVASEVPSNIVTVPNFSNALPATQVLPASFYLSSVPSFWATPFGTPAWPPIGPDVANGNLNGTAPPLAPTGGHANKIPARLCFENTGNHPAYASSNPRVKLFNAASCYNAAGVPPPAAPSNLNITVP